MADKDLQPYYFSEYYFISMQITLIYKDITAGQACIWHIQKKRSTDQILDKLMLVIFQWVHEESSGKNKFANADIKSKQTKYPCFGMP